MRSLAFLVLLGIGLQDQVAAQDVPLVTSKACKNNSREEIDHVVKTICADQQVYRLLYDEKRSNIVLVVGDRTTILHKIPRGRDPNLVGTDSIIGFLPDRLQPYKGNKVLVYFSSIRTNSGGGGGQCGSGAETYLNFLDIGQSPPRIRSSLLVGSCNEPIELVDQEMTRGKFGDISVLKGTLLLNFLLYRRMQGDTVARVSPDFKRLLFN